MNGWIKETNSARRSLVFKILRELKYKKSEGEHTINWEKEDKKITVGPFHIWFFVKDSFDQWEFDSRSNISDEDIINYIKYFS